MKKTERQQQIVDLKNKIIANSKDARFAKSAIADLLSLQRQEEIDPVELSIPISEITDVADAGPWKISKTVRGYLFQCKRGLHTFIGLEYGGLCSMMQEAMDAINKGDKASEFATNYVEAIGYVFQSPLFAAMGKNLPLFNKPAEYTSLFIIATAILREFNDFYNRHGIVNKPHTNTEEDIKQNIAMENLSEALESIAESVE